VLACRSEVVHHADIHVPDEGWSRDWRPEFAFSIADTNALHDVYIDLRHTGDYAFSDLYLFATVRGPGLPPAVDTVECLLADPAGRWYGKGRGYIHSLHLLYKAGKRFPRPGRYSIELEQAMRVDPLEHVLDVGISVEKPRIPG
jgi:gliding motility-associated lipoprotein GldH